MKKREKGESNRQFKAKRRGLLLNSLGIFFLAAGILRIIVLISLGDLRYFIWFSNNVLLVIGAGILMHSRLIVTAELCIALIPETLWSIDLIGKLLFNRYIFGVTGYVFEKGFALSAMSSLQHLLIVPLGLFALWFLGSSRDAWKFSFLHVSLLWIFGFLIGEKYNLNCVFHYCIGYFKDLNNYMLAWPLIVLFIILLSNLIIQALDFLKKKKYGPEVR